MWEDLRNRQGERLDASFTPGAPGGRDLVLITHGVTSHKDRPWLESLDRALGQAGLATLRFSFSGNGGSEGRYEDSSISKEVEDLGAILDATGDWRVTYVGHSMGGAVGMLRASRDPRIRAFVSLAGMVHVQAFMEHHFGGLCPDQDVMLGKAHCPLTRAFLEDAAAIESVLPLANQIHVPWRIVHGTADDIVPFQDALDVVSASEGRANLATLEGVDHRFTDHLADLQQAVVPWLQQTLEALGPTHDP